jgi:tetratricopeptide (TPR) repeat protein
VYAHDAAGNPAVQFIQSKAFDRRKLKWVNKVHEVLQGDAKRIFVDSNVIMLEHFQEPFKDHRSNYLTGLGVDSYENPGNDRNLFYCAREMMYHGRPKSAIKAFMRHEKLQGWDAERGQNLIYTGDCYGTLNEPEKQLEYYHKGFDAYPKRREALIRIASYYRHRNNPHATAAYANAALVIPQTGFYADAMNEYRETPHELLSWACGQIGDIEAAKFHLMRCLDYIPNNRKYLEDTKLYFPYWEKFIEGWTSFRELLWLYTRATEMTSILEIGSWCGRSGNALLSGCKGKVTCVDTFKGTDDVNDLTYKQGENNSVYEKFMNTNGHFENLEVLKMSSKEAFEVLKDRKFDMIFVDANHTYEGVKEDIEMYQGLATKIFCGHDYTYPWLGVKAAVDECVGPVGLEDSIWYKYV